MCCALRNIGVAAHSLLHTFQREQNLLSFWWQLRTIVVHVLVRCARTAVAADISSPSSVHSRGLCLCHSKLLPVFPGPSTLTGN